MSWNYRVVEHQYDDEESGYRIHEVYYDKDVPVAITEAGIDLSGYSLDDLKSSFELIKLAFDKPVLKYEDF